MRSEEVPEAPPAWPEGQGGVQVEAAGPVGLSSQEVTCGTSNISTPTAKPTDQLLPGCLATRPGACNTFTLWTQTIHAESSDASGTPQVEPEGSTPIGHLINMRRKVRSAGSQVLLSPAYLAGVLTCLRCCWICLRWAESDPPTVSQTGPGGQSQGLKNC